MARENGLWSRWVRQTRKKTKQKKHLHGCCVLKYKKQNLFCRVWKTWESHPVCMYIQWKFMQTQLFLLDFQCLFSSWSSTFFLRLILSPQPNRMFSFPGILLPPVTRIWEKEAALLKLDLCVCWGMGMGETISAIWKLPGGFCHVTLTPLEWLCWWFQRRLEPVVLSRCVRRSIFLISQTWSRLNLRSEQIGLIRILGFTIRWFLTPLSWTSDSVSVRFCFFIKWTQSGFLYLCTADLLGRMSLCITECLAGPWLSPLGAQSTLQLWRSKLSPHIAECTPKGKITFHRKPLD